MTAIMMNRQNEQSRSHFVAGEIPIELVRKNIKNLHLHVTAPDGRVWLSAPKRMPLRAIRAFALSRLDWIVRQQTKIRARGRVARPEYVDGERHWVWGRSYRLAVVERDQTPEVRLNHEVLELSVRPGANRAKRQPVVEAWSREQLKLAIPLLLETWQPKMGVRTEGFYVRRMNTRWGSCNIRARTIRLNTELVKKPPECLEYVVVHELAHLLERHHNARFWGLLDQFLPDWRVQRDELNRVPLVGGG